MLVEPWNSLLFIVALPVVVQLLKFAADKLGKPLPVYAVQAIAGVLAALFVFVSGGFAGLEIPVFAGDPATFIGAWLALLLAAWGPVELLYRIALKALFERVGL